MLKAKRKSPKMGVFNLVENKKYIGFRNFEAESLDEDWLRLDVELLVDDVVEVDDALLAGRVEFVHPQIDVEEHILNSSFK